MDDIDGCIKNSVYRAVMAEKNVIHTPLDFTKSVQKLVKGVKCMYLPEEDVMIELDKIKNTKCSTKMHILKVHMAYLVIAQSGFQCLQFYQIASYKEPFNKQWYRREDELSSK